MISLQFFAHTQQNGATLKFDNNTGVRNNPDKDIMLIVAGEAF